MPTIVIESGWTSSRPKLHEDMKLWLEGGAGDVQLVFLFKWSQLTGGRVKGDIEVHNLNPAGNTTLLQAQVIINQSSIVKLVADGSRQFSLHQSLQLQLQLR